MSQGVARKWRPALWFVLAGPVAAVLALPMLGVGALWLVGGTLGWAGTYGLIAVTALLASAVLGYLLWRLVLHPVHRLTDHAKTVARGAEGQPLVHFGTPEFRDLGQAVAEMGRVLRGREQVVRSYADHVTHELKSPLSAIAGAAELLDGDLPHADRVRLLATITGAVARMDDLLEDQRAFARASDPLAPGAVHLAEVAQRWPQAQVSADGVIPLPAQVVGIVLENLISNALAHGAKTVTLRCEADALWVADDGTGVSPGNRDRIFDPFFTTRRADGGTGMGLAILRRMLEAQGAEIALSDTETDTGHGPGAVFVVRWSPG